MGVVYLAEHPVIGKKVAMKAIHPELSRNAEVVSRFMTEAKSVNQIGHEHIVDITDFGNDARRRVLLRDGVPAGRGAGRPPQAREPRSAGAQALIDRARRSPTRWTPRTSTASSTATSSPRTSSSSSRGGEPRLRQGARLRPGQADRSGDQKVDPQDAHRLGDGHAVLHVPRAVRGEERRSTTAPTSTRWA